ncbi:MAG: ABC transporter permease [bacterium]|nr:ABC transporter permease [bacterium]
MKNSTLLESLYILKCITWALFIKEFKVRFSNKGYMTYFWIIGEPLMHISFFIILFMFIMGRSTRMGLPIPLVILTGIIPFLFFRRLVIQSMNSVNANQALLHYKQITILSTLIARLYVELFLALISALAIYLIYCYFGLFYSIYNFILIFFIFFLLILFTFGTMLMMSVIGFFFEETQIIVNFILRFAYLFSGVIFDINIIPVKYQKILLLNPIFQVISLIRNTFIQYKLPASRDVDLNYLITISIVTLFLGLSIYYITKQEFIKKARARS